MSIIRALSSCCVRLFHNGVYAGMVIIDAVFDPESACEFRWNSVHDFLKDVRRTI